MDDTKRLSRGDGEAQKAICEALGLNPAQTRSITIEMHASAVAAMTVTQFLTEAQVDGLAKAIRKFRYNVKE